MYIASITDRNGKVRVRSGAYSTREEAAKAVFVTRPAAKRCSTARASLVGNKWCDFGFDIQWHERYLIEA